MRRQVIAAALAGALALSACGSSSSSSTATTASKDSSSATANGSVDKAVSSAKDCPALMKAAQPVFVDLFQGLADATQKLTAEDLTKLAQGGAEDSGLIKDFTARLEENLTGIEAKAKDLKCDEADAKKAMCEAVTKVDGKGNVLAETMISSMSSECA